MKNLIVALYVFPFVIIASCSMAIPVHGKIKSSEEIFTGHLTATSAEIMRGNGKLLINFDKTPCQGNLVNINRQEGEGILICDDGRTGSFKLISTGMQITGFGNVGDKIFELTFGKK